MSDKQYTDCRDCHYKFIVDGNAEFERMMDCEAVVCSRCDAEISRDEMADNYGYRCTLEAATEDAGTAYFFLCEKCQMDAESFLRGVEHERD